MWSQRPTRAPPTTVGPPHRPLIGDVELDEPCVGAVGPQCLLGLLPSAGVPGAQQDGRATGAEQPGGFEADALVGPGNQRGRGDGSFLRAAAARRGGPATPRAPPAPRGGPGAPRAPAAALARVAWGGPDSTS